MSTLDLAEHYVRDLGWAVFPLAPESKQPASGSRGFHDATRDLRQIRAWWRREPRYGIGLPCETFVVLDVDVRDGKPGRESLAALEAEHGPLPDTWGVETPSGGLHYYFAAVPDLTVRRAIGVRPGIDVLGVGGYVCAPPTVTSEGSYRWIGDDVGLAPVPRWIAELRATSRRVAWRPAEPVRFRGRYGADVADRAERARAYLAKLPVAVSGQHGHDALWRASLACVRGFELPETVAMTILSEYSARCLPPWSEHEIAHKVMQAQRATASPGYLLPERS